MPLYGALPPTYAPLAAQLDDPTNASGLGAPAILRGTVRAAAASGLIVGAGQATAVRQANLAALQAAINKAASLGKFFEIEPGTYEIYGSAGLVIPTTGTLEWHGVGGSNGSLILQCCPNAPILTIGDTTGVNYAPVGQRISGFCLDYGVSQTGNTGADGLVLGACYGVTIEHGQVCRYYGTNPPYIGIVITAGNGPNAFFFQNVMHDLQVGGAQQSLFSRTTSGTGNLFSDVYLHNGSSPSTRQACAGSAVVVNPAGLASDDTYLRFNIEHVTANTILEMHSTMGATFIDPHLEDIGLSGYSPQVFLFVGGANNRMISTAVLDLQLASGVNGSPALYRPSGYGETPNFDGLTLKWSSTFGSVLGQNLAIVAAVNAYGNDTNPAVRISDLYIQDDTGSSNAKYLALDPNMATVPLTSGANIFYLREFHGDNVLPTTRQMQPTITAAYTHYGRHEDAVLFVPASITSFALTLSNKAIASGVGNNVFTRAGNTVRVRRLSGTVSGTLTVVDAASAATLTTNAASATDLVFQFNGQNWVLGGSGQVSALNTNAQTASYTLGLSDLVNTVVEINAASAATLTVPPDSSVASIAGNVVEICQTGTGQVTIAAGSGVTVHTSSSLTTRAQWSSLSLRKQAAANTWVLSGDMT